MNVSGKLDARLQAGDVSDRSRRGRARSQTVQALLLMLAFGLATLPISFLWPGAFIGPLAFVGWLGAKRAPWHEFWKPVAFAIALLPYVAQTWLLHGRWFAVAYFAGCMAALLLLVWRPARARVRSAAACE